MELIVSTKLIQGAIISKKTVKFEVYPFDAGSRAVMKSILLAKGDIIYASAAGVATILPAAADGTYLTLTGGIPAWAAIAVDNTFGLTNRSGLSRATGSVVVMDSTNDSAFTVSSLAGDPSVVGVLTATCDDGALGKIANQGNTVVDVLVQGNVIRGHWLINSTTAGRAADSGYVQRPTSGGIGIALTAYSGGGAGTVKCLLNTNPFSSTATLQQLSTISTGNNITSSPATVSHTTDTGTDLLVVCVTTLFGSNVTVSSITFNGVALTLHYNYTLTLTNWHSNCIAYLKSPPIGTYNLVITYGGAFTRSKYCAMNFIGSQVTPLRAVVSTAGNVTSGTLTPVSAVGDIILDSAEIHGTPNWSPDAGQTIKFHDYGLSDEIMVTTKPGLAGTTQMKVSGTLADLNYAAVAIAGS